jgi:hypothetical protein
MKASKPVTIGAEMDGSTLSVVRVEDNTVVYYERFSHLSGTAAAAMIRQLLTGRDRAVMSWASAGVATRRVQVPAIVERKMGAAIRAVIDRHIPAGSELPGAGLVQSRPGSPGPTAMVGAITSESARVLRHEMGNAQCSLIVAPFTLSHDGTYLAIRESCAELTLVRGGIPVSTRQLTGGGLSAWSEIEPMLLSQGSLSVENTAALRRYLASLSREVYRTIELWERNGETCPRTAWAFGVGATLPHLPAFLKNVGVTLVPAPISSSLDVGIIPQAERLAAYGALAAATLQVDRQPFIDISRPTTAVFRNRRISRTSTTSLEAFEGVLTSNGTRGFASPSFGRLSESALPRGTASALMAAVGVALFAGYSWISSGRSIDDAQRAVDAAKRELLSSQNAAELAEVLPIAARELDSFSNFVAPDWVAVVTRLLSSLPAEPRATSVTFTSENGFVQARFVIAIPKEKMGEWQVALSQSGATVVILPLDDSANGSAEYLLNFDTGIPSPAGSGL